MSPVSALCTSVDSTDVMDGLPGIRLDEDKMLPYSSALCHPVDQEYSFVHHAAGGTYRRLGRPDHTARISKVIAANLII